MGVIIVVLMEIGRFETTSQSRKFIHIITFDNWMVGPLLPDLILG